MESIERRAMLGDQQAQEECTRRGIVLPCPMCGKYLRERKTVDWLAKRTEPVNRTIVEHPCKTGCHLDNWVFVKEKELDSWNTRPAPPVGRCGECEHWYKGHCSTGSCATEETDADFYCPNFQAIKTSDKQNKR